MQITVCIWSVLRETKSWRWERVLPHMCIHCKELANHLKSQDSEEKSSYEHSSECASSSQCQWQLFNVWTWCPLDAQSLGQLLETLEVLKGPGWICHILWPHMCRNYYLLIAVSKGNVKDSNLGMFQEPKRWTSYDFHSIDYFECNHVALGNYFTVWRVVVQEVSCPTTKFVCTPGQSSLIFFGYLKKHLNGSGIN